MTPVYSARDPLEAHLLRAVLESEGLEAEVRGEYVPFDLNGALSIWVNDDGVDRARTVLEAFFRRRDLTIEPD